MPRVTLLKVKARARSLPLLYSNSSHRHIYEHAKPEKRCTVKAQFERKAE